MFRIDWIEVEGPVGAAAPLRPAPGVHASASVRLSARPWGTQVDFAAARIRQLTEKPAGDGAKE